MDETILEKIRLKLSVLQDIIEIIYNKAVVYNQITKDLDYSVDWAIIDCIDKYKNTNEVFKSMAKVLYGK